MRNYKYINGVLIVECVSCSLGQTNNLKKESPNNEGLYNLSDYKKQVDKLKIRFERIIQRVKKIKNHGTVLDIGCGFGLFSSLLLKNGYEVVALEPSLNPYYISNKNVEFYKSDIKEFLKKRNQKKKYDVVFILDVLEHFNNPKRVLVELFNILNKRGFIVVQVPNYKSIMANLCRRWSWWMIEEHKYHFSPKSIELLLNMCNYKIVEMRTYEDTSDFITNMDGNFVNISNRYFRKMLKGITYSLFFPMYLMTRRFLWNLGYGGLILIIATPNNK